jgi:ligand-binding sensor domain-containing protein/signal transduction histidine kinase/DNA-binding response OmpR family regulator
MRERHVGTILVALTALILLLPGSAAAQKRDFRFHYYTADQGLSQNHIDCILRDSRGYMWFGTRNGLNRFDGYRFTVFERSPGKENTISNNFVQALCEDRYGNIWIGTSEGLNVYVFEEDRFISVTSDSAGHLSLQSLSINSIICDNEGALWIGTDNGALKITLDGSGGRIRTNQYFLAVRTPGSLSGNLVYCIYQDRYERIWVGTDQGLNLYDPGTGSFMAYRSNPENPATLSSDEVMAVFLDRSGNLWVGTSTGLNRFDLQHESFERYYHIPDQASSVAHNIINSITEDQDGNVLVGTLGGLSIYNPEGNDFYNYAFDINTSSGINNDFVNSVLADDVGNVWIGTERGGINRYNIYQNEFEYYEHLPGNEQSLSHNTVNSILEDGKSLWIGTAGGGLNRFDKHKGTYTHFRYQPGVPDVLNSDFITSILRDRRGYLWVGTWGSGLNLLSPRDEARGKFTHFVNQAGEPNSLASNYVSSMIEDGKGNLWIGTRGGIVVHRPGSRVFEHVHGDNSGLQISRVGCLRFDNAGNLWAGTEEGLYRVSARVQGEINPSDCNIKRYLKAGSDPGSISGNYVISIYLDRQGTLWFGTYGNGLNKLVTDSLSGRESFICYTRKEGLVNDIVYGILEDKDGNLWLSTDNGLSKFDPVRESFKNYSVSDGLLNNQFYWSACYRNENGKLYFGGMKGLLAFYPDDIIDREFRPNLTFTDFRIYNQPVGIGSEYYDRVVLDMPISRTDRITLPHKVREFSFEFSALDYDRTDKIRYSYFLQGFDEGWNYLGPERRYVSYTNLKGGDYILMIDAALIEGDWSGEPLSIGITIIPPLWERMWFLGSVFLVLVLSVVAYNRYRTVALKQRKKMLEILVRERTQQIEGQKKQLEMQNIEIIEQRDKLMELNKKVQQANQQQMRFFTHMSHEFRSPLTLVISPLDEIINEIDGKNPLQSKLLLVRRNAKRLLHLVNQLMEVRRIKTGNIEIKAVELDLVPFLENISLPFGDLARQRQISYEFISERKSLFTFIDKEKLEIIFYNLVSNAIKYTPENGSISIRVSLSDPESFSQLPETNVAIVKQKGDLYNKYVTIGISDTGIGIESEYLKDIFKRFYRNPVGNPEFSPGTGIGLYLTKELIRTHRGWLFVRSTPGQGSEFRFMIPYGREYLSEHEIIGKVERPSLVPRENLGASLLSEYFRSESERKHKIPSPVGPYLPVKPLILLVDDDYELCEFVSGCLDREFEVMTAGDGEEGLEKARQYLPDLILSDTMMPRMDGYELCSKVKSDLQTSHIPFVLLSARSDEEDLIEGLEVGADDYITKPFELKILEARIKTLIENRQKLRKLFGSSLIADLRKVTTNSVDNKFLRHSVEIVEKNLINSEFGVQSLAEQLNISRSLLHKKLTSIVGQSANDFIVSIRLKHSAKLILDGNRKISEIAYQVGFNDPKYFTRCFKKFFGKTPSEYMHQQI